MIIGLDIGASAVKVIGLEGENVIFTHSESSREKDLDKLLKMVIAESGHTVGDVSKVAITGVGWEETNLKKDLVPITYVPEIEATGEGGTWLSQKDNCIVVSIGTGTCLVLAKNGVYSHVGGSGVGSGTLRGLSKRLFATTDLYKLFTLAEDGNRLTVDITIGDLFSGTDTLPPDLTASNLAKASDQATMSDWAYAIINTVMEVGGSHAALACGGYGVDTVVITGGISQTQIAKAVYDNFTNLYKLDYIIPRYSDCATAIGAARRIQNVK